MSAGNILMWYWARLSELHYSSPEFTLHWQQTLMARVHYQRTDIEGEIQSLTKLESDLAYLETSMTLFDCETLYILSTLSIPASLLCGRSKQKRLGTLNKRRNWGIAYLALPTWLNAIESVFRIVLHDDRIHVELLVGILTLLIVRWCCDKIRTVEARTVRLITSKFGTINLYCKEWYLSGEFIWATETLDGEKPSG